ncbi:MAG: hypothetical protein M3Q26_11340 [Acidobacteriota bacterium]|nr:hypothetical protein [Acidobacteriota bacterium]
MTNLMKHLLFLMLIAIVTALTAIGLAQNRQQESRSNEIEKHIALRDALRRGGMRAAAELNGGYMGSLDPNPDWLRFDIEMLTKNSHAMIIGVPLRNKGKLSIDGSTVNTVYEVVVYEVIKGNVEQGSVITVALPGGKISFADGITAEIRTPGFRKMKNGKTYALFLNESNDDGVFNLTAGPQGLLELLSQSGEVLSHAKDGSLSKSRLETKVWMSFLKKPAIKPGSILNPLNATVSPR